MQYEYRMREIYRKNNKHAKWLKCTESQKQQLETSAGNKFEFRELKKPEPTPSMEKVSKMKNDSQNGKDSQNEKN